MNPRLPPLPPRSNVLVPLRGAIVAALALALLVGCGDGGSTASSTTVAPTTTAAPTTTTAAPEPLRIIVAGDSIAYDVGPALDAALPPAAAEVVSMVIPALTTPTLRNQLATRTTEAPTDLVIVMVGVWERGYKAAAGSAFGEEGWSEDYEAAVLDPFVETMRSTGTRVLLLLEPPMRDDSGSADVVQLEEIWHRFAAKHPEMVSVAESGTWLAGATGYQELAAGEGGELTRLRRTDGIHLCAEGAARLARGLIELIPSLVDRAWQPELVPGWETSDWVARFPAEECPPPPAP